MQLTARRAPIEEDEQWFVATPAVDAPVDAPISAAAREADARRCLVCQTRFPSFGYGPPLTRPNQTVWACGPHLREVECRLMGRPSLDASATTGLL